MHNVIPIMQGPLLRTDGTRLDGFSYIYFTGLINIIIMLKLASVREFVFIDITLVTQWNNVIKKPINSNFSVVFEYTKLTLRQFRRNFQCRWSIGHNIFCLNYITKSGFHFHVVLISLYPYQNSQRILELFRHEYWKAFLI